jgi:hypothetical protein
MADASPPLMCRIAANVGRREKYGLIALALLLIVWTIGHLVWIFSIKPNRDQRNMDSALAAFPNKLGTVTPAVSKDYALRDFMVASSLDSCCSSAGGLYNHVGVAPLRDVIAHGARCLDFEVFTVDGEPVVATSMDASVHSKASLNYLPFGTAMSNAAQYGFQGGRCQNAGDPLLISIRMNTKQSEVYPAMAAAIKKSFGNRLLGPEYGNEYGGKNIGTVPLRQLMGKAVVLYSGPPTNNVDFNKLVNGSTGGVFLRKLTHYDVKYTHDPNELVAYNKQNMSLVVPSPNEERSMPASLAYQYGCQFMCMDYSTPDANMEYMLAMFNEAGSAFILKPEPLRAIIKTVPKPPPQNPDYSFAARTLSKPYFTAKI